MNKLFIILTIIVGLWAIDSDAAVFYADLTVNPHTGVTCSTTGTSTSSPFCSIDLFTEAARSAGDIVFVRRGNATTSHSSVVGALGLTSSGSDASPIIISADNDNLWNDFATSSQTYTVTTGSTTLAASATITGVAVSDFIYVQGDCGETFNTSSVNLCDYYYEVSAVAAETLTLYQPYAGFNGGSGRSLRILPNNPVRGIATCTTCEMTASSDNNWMIIGVDFLSSDTEVLLFTDASNFDIRHSIFQSSGTTDDAVALNSRVDSISFFNTRFFNYENAFNIPSAASGLSAMFIRCKQCYLDGNLVAASSVVESSETAWFEFENSIFIDNVQAPITLARGSVVFARNITTNTTKTILADGLAAELRGYFEDYLREVGDNRQYRTSISTSYAGNGFLQSTSTVRSGGGSNTIMITPTTDTGISYFNNIKLFDYPIYTNTTSKIYSIFFKNSTTTAEFLTNPTLDELWIEAEFWDFASPGTSTRRTIKSTGVIDFIGSPTTWQSLSVTAQPSTTGILYLKGWYRKTKETGILNQFLIDSTPVIQ